MLTIPINIFKKRGGKRREHRLYIAYYYRTPTPSNPARYHTALVVIPTPATGTDVDCASECDSPSSSVPPSPSSPTFQPPFTLPPTNSPSSPASNLPSSTTTPTKSQEKTKNMKATKFHVINVPVNENGRGRVIWQQRVESEYLDASRPFPNLRSRLACLMFVGHVSSDSKVERTLKKVQVNKYADEFPDYLCTTWMDEALAVLVDQKVIDPLPGSPTEFWEIGAQYADKWKQEGHGSHIAEIDGEIPCCDRDGNGCSTPLGSVSLSATLCAQQCTGHKV